MADTPDAAEPSDPPPRPLRTCDVCLEVDDHPRDTIAYPIGSNRGVAIPADVLDALPHQLGAKYIAAHMNPDTTIRHINCCAAQGCEACIASEEENGGRRGQALIDHLAATRALSVEEG